MKRALKRAIQGAVAATLPRTWRWKKSALLVLMYHRVLPKDHPSRATEQPGMYVAPETLALHLEVLREHFTFVHLDDWLEASAAGRAVPERACAITFDDGWRDNFDHAYPVLRKQQVPATIFLVSDLVGTQYRFWPNALAKRLMGFGTQELDQLPRWMIELMPGHVRRVHVLDMDCIDAIIVECKARYSDAEIVARLAEWSPDNPVAQERDLMDWDEIRLMLRDGLVRFGSHTRNHTRLAGTLTQETLQEEIAGSARCIHEHLDVAPATFCYPNGDTSAEAIECVRRVYRGAVTTAHGWNGVGSDPFTLNRVGVHDDVSASRSAFLSRLAGFG